MIRKEKYKLLIKGYQKWKRQTANIKLSQMRNTNVWYKVITNVKYKRGIKGDHKWIIQTAKKGDHKWKIQTGNKRLSQMKNTNG